MGSAQKIKNQKIQCKLLISSANCYQQPTLSNTNPEQDGKPRKSTFFRTFSFSVLNLWGKIIVSSIIIS